MKSTPRGILPLLVLVACGWCASAQPAPSISQLVREHGNLERGDSGPAIGHVQRRLVALGSTIAVDGEFGPITERAVRAFQAAQGLVVDGIVGPRTAARLDAPRAAATTARRRNRGAAGVLAGLPKLPDRPRPRADLTRARADARARARASSTSTLVICFEGLWSYSSSYTRRVYAYHDALRRGERARVPSGPMSFLTKRLVVPNMSARRRFELLVLPETSEDGARSVGEQVALAWHQVHGARLRLVIMGHSFGGYSALRLANKLDAHGVPVDALLAVDPRTTPGNYRHFVRPRNVRALYTYFQKGFMPGYAIDGATLNQRVRGVSHGTIPGADVVQRRYRAIVPK